MATSDNLSAAQFDRYKFPEGHSDAWTNDVQYYHGSSRDYSAGDVIDPRKPHDKAGPESSASSVYFTSDPHKASFYAERSAKNLGGEARVYSVNPLGNHTQDRMTVRSPENRSSFNPVVVTGKHEATDWRGAGYAQR